MPHSIHFYENWVFWSFVVALIAVVLSQLPPLNILFQRAKLSLEVYSKIHIAHALGNPNVQLHLIVINIGGREVTINAIKVNIKRDGTDELIIKGQNYLPDSSATGKMLLTRFILKPKQEYSHLINFFNSFERSEEKMAKTLIQELKQDINEKIINDKKMGVTRTEAVEAEEEIVKKIHDFFEDKFYWEPGEYELTVNVSTRDHRADIKKSYRFTLFESDSEELKEYAEAYKIGDGVYFDTGNQPGIILSLKEMES